MFWSDKYLAKTGPLAKVWLAANIERKLSKSQVLQQDIRKSVDVIIEQPEGPFALRTSSQLLLGVVKIHGKKAKYLQDDCHEALLKIRMTFSKNTGSHDLAPGATVGLDLNLPELLTVEDLFPSMDFGYPLTQQPALDAPDQDYDQDWTSTLNPQHSTQARLSPDEGPLLNDEDLGLDFGDDANDTTVSVQYGRNAPAAQLPDDDILGGVKIYEDDLQLDLGEDVEMEDQPAPVPHGDDMHIPDMNGGPALGDDETELLRQQVAQQPRADSPLSEAISEVLRNLDQTYAQQEEDISEVAVQQRQSRRKFKPLVADVETMLHNRDIKAHAEDRSKILKAPSFLPRDPFLLTLMEGPRTGHLSSKACCPSTLYTEVARNENETVALVV
jgi:cohesin complex subunit SCC1